MIVGLEAQHDHRCGVRRARKSEAVRIFDAETVDADDVRCAREVGVRLQLRNERMLLAFAAGDVQFRCGKRIGQRFQDTARVGLAGQDLEQACTGIQPVVVLRFEANDAAALARIQNEFRKVLARVKPGAALPF